MPLHKAVIDAARYRFRPILLTSLTTFLGLAPITIFETSTQAQLVIPMAASLAFGILFATLITLILIPTLYLILDDFKSWWKEAWRQVRAIGRSEGLAPGRAAEGDIGSRSRSQES